MGVLPLPRDDSAACLTRQVKGFTLVELMVTIAVAATLLVIAVPSFRSIINSNRLTTAANTVVNALNVARMEAIKRNAYTQLCSDSASNNTSDTLGSACSAASAGAGAVVVQTGASTALPVLGAAQGLVMPVQLSGNITAIRFDGLGVGYQAGTTSLTGSTYSGTVAVLCVAGLSGNNRITISMTTGTIVTTTSSAGGCP